VTIAMNPLWEIPGQFFGDLPVITNGLILVDKLAAPRNLLTAIALETGEAVWQFDPGGVWPPNRAVESGVLYVSSSQDRTTTIRALRIQDRSMIWQRTVSPSWRHFGPATIMPCDDALVAFADNGSNEHVIFNLNKLTGQDLSAPQAIAHGEDGFSIHSARILFIRSVNRQKLELWQRATSPGGPQYNNVPFLEYDKTIILWKLVDSSLFIALIQNSQDEIGTLVALNFLTKDVIWQKQVIGWPELLAANSDHLLFQENSATHTITLESRSRQSGGPEWNLLMGDAYYHPGKSEFTRDMFIVSLLSQTGTSADRTNIIVGLDVNSGAEKFRLVRTSELNALAEIALSGDKIVLLSPNFLLVLNPDYLWRRKYSAFRTVPIILNRTIALVTVSGRVITVDLDSGRENWANTFNGTVACSPVMIDDRVYICHSGFISALSAPTGNEIWTLNLSADIVALSAITNDLIVYANNDRLLGSISKGGVKGWQLQSAGVVNSGFAHDGSTLYFGDDAGVLYAIQANGNEAWPRKSIAAVAIHCVLLLATNTILYGDASGQVIAVNSSAGTVLWSVNLGAAVEAMSAIPGGSDVLACDARGIVHRIRMSDHSEVWASAPVGSVRSAPAVVNDRAFVATGAGAVVALDINTGREVRRIDLGASGQTYLAGHPEAIIVADESGYIQALLP
jgi:outer membrane protein assembly factor BamB